MGLAPARAGAPVAQKGVGLTYPFTLVSYTQLIILNPISFTQVIALISASYYALRLNVIGLLFCVCVYTREKHMFRRLVLLFA